MNACVEIVTVLLLQTSVFSVSTACSHYWTHNKSLLKLPVVIVAALLCWQALKAVTKSLTDTGVVSMINAIRETE